MWRVTIPEPYTDGSCPNTRHGGGVTGLRRLHQADDDGAVDWLNTRGDQKVLGLT